MKAKSWPSIVLRNMLGIAALLLMHYISDRYYLHTRSGFQRGLPYVFLLTLYGWIVFHNRVLFERLYLAGRKKAYLGWTLMLMSISTFNLAVILIYLFDVTDILPNIVSFWVYTFAGLGVFAVFSYARKDQAVEVQRSAAEILHCNVDGIVVGIPVRDIRYVESYENYVKVFTERKTFVTRLPMKTAEQLLPKDLFVRISRSHIANILHVTAIENDSLVSNGSSLKVGKVYKRYVAERLREKAL